MKPPDPLDIDVDDDLFSSSQQIRRASEGGTGTGGRDPSSIVAKASWPFTETIHEAPGS
jgi:hypothetical protein